jgi:hypothetical protein
MKVEIRGEFKNLAELQVALFQLAIGIGTAKKKNSVPDRMETTGEGVAKLTLKFLD